MKYLIVVFFCAITFSVSSQTNTPISKVAVQVVSASPVGLVPKPATLYNSRACCHCLYRLAFDIPRIQPAVDMYIRHYFGISYWD